MKRRSENPFEPTIAPKWAETCATGAREIDSTNECLQFVLQELFLNGRRCPGDTETCPKIVDVERFLFRKFAREEGLMDRVGYPGGGAHRADHARFLARLRVMQDELVCGAYDPEALYALLTDWTVDHVSLFDAEFGRFLAARPRHRPMSEKSAQPLENGLAGKNTPPNGTWRGDGAAMRQE